MTGRSTGQKTDTKPDIKHLRDLFRTGKMVTVSVPDPRDYEKSVAFDIWMQKPSTSQQEEALAAARARAARKKALFRDAESDEMLMIAADVDDLERDELKDRLAYHQSAQFKSQAFNDVLYDPDHQVKDEDGESKYGPEGIGYADLLQALAERIDEINTLNADLSEAEVKDRWIDLADDEEYQRLVGEKDEFEAKVAERAEYLRQKEIETYQGIPDAELRKMLRKRFMETELNLAWFETYKAEMLWRACRYPDDHKRRYFSNPAEILDLPREVVEYLMSHYESIDFSGGEVKN